MRNNLDLRMKMIRSATSRINL